MAFNLRNRNFLKLLDFTPEEIKFLLKLAADLKAAKYAGTEQPRLTGKVLLVLLRQWLPFWLLRTISFLQQSTTRMEMRILRLITI